MCSVQYFFRDLNNEFGQVWIVSSHSVFCKLLNFFLLFRCYIAAVVAMFRWKFLPENHLRTNHLSLVQIFGYEGISTLISYRNSFFHENEWHLLGNQKIRFKFNILILFILFRYFQMQLFGRAFISSSSCAAQKLDKFDSDAPQSKDFPSSRKSAMRYQIVAVIDMIVVTILFYFFFQ